MEVISAALNWLNGIVWGVPMLILILGVGLYLTVGLRLRSVLNVPLSVAFLWRGRAAEGKGEISPFNALIVAGSTVVIMNAKVSWPCWVLLSILFLCAPSRLSSF
jgi:Na+/alanine symporter